jgi:hypothetical protein
VGKLNDFKLRIEQKIQADRLDPVAIKGKLSLKSGTLLAFINPNTPDNPEAIEKLKRAAKEVLNLAL